MPQEPLEFGPGKLWRLELWLYIYIYNIYLRLYGHTLTIYLESQRHGFVLFFYVKIYIYIYIYMNKYRLKSAGQWVKVRPRHNTYIGRSHIINSALQMGPAKEKSQRKKSGFSHAKIQRPELWPLRAFWGVPAWDRCSGCTAAVPLLTHATATLFWRVRGSLRYGLFSTAKLKKPLNKKKRFS
jgi:hypothetical protein